MSRLITIASREHLLSRTVQNLNGCMEWNGSFFNTGYGSVSYKNKTQLAHRFIWKITHGDIPKGMNINHKCDNPKCINTDHLYVGTQKENINDQALRKRHKNNKMTHCHRGHEFTKENTTFAKSPLFERPSRQCKTCKKIWDRDYKDRKYKKSIVSMAYFLYFSRNDNNLTINQNLGR